MQSFTHTVKAGDTAQIDISIGDDDTIGCIVFEVKSASGTYSFTPQVKKQSGSGVYFDAAYSVFPTQTATDAGTAITADGIYEIAADGCVVSLHVTDATDSFTIYATKYAGASL